MSKLHLFLSALAILVLVTGCDGTESTPVLSPDELFAQFKSHYLDHDDDVLGDPTSEAGVQALAALDKAARSGHAEAQLHLGLMLSSGVILPQDQKNGIYWLLLSAQQGNPDAQLLVAIEFHNLALEQESPDELKRLMANSLRWFKIAGANGSVEGRMMAASIMAGEPETRSQGTRQLGDLAIAGDAESKEMLLLMRETAIEVEQMLLGREESNTNSGDSELNEMRRHVREIDEQLSRIGATEDR